MNDQFHDVAIIGAGVVGCAIARELAGRLKSVLLLDKEVVVGFHTSGRNSGVVHSGFNPKPGTLKARLCVEGNRLIRQYCKERGIPCEKVGTYVVAVDEAQVLVLEELKRRGEKNGVPGIEILAFDRVREHEPNVKGVAAMYSPTGAIVDSLALSRALADDAVKLGATLALGQEVMRIAETPDAAEITTRRGAYRARVVINCAGLHADRLAHMMGVGRDYTIAPFRGEYFVVRRPGPPLVRSMVYPVPHPKVPFLGVHLTRTVAGSVLIGPNAVPAFGREAYKWSQVHWRDLAEMASHKGIWNAFIRNRDLVKVAWNELRRSGSRRYFWKEARRLVEGLKLEELTLESRVGIRPQLIRSNGELVDDLVIETTTHTIHVLNVVSPGMTSALAFAKWLSGGINSQLEWTERAFG
jgi:(S)-2-hydroxyglutarate dehydrogenase